MAAHIARTATSTPSLLRPLLFRPRYIMSSAQVHARYQQYASLPPRHGVPQNSWDSHMHVVGSIDQYPLDKAAPYKPDEVHTVEDACAFECSHGTPRMVLVQPSIYGFDNSCLLDALKVLTPKYGRGIVETDPKTIDPAMLNEWHALGVRGIRVNVKSVSDRIIPRDEFEQLLRPYADAIRPLGWVLDIHVALPMLETLEAFAPSLGVRICIDHYGGPSLSSSQTSEQPYQLQGFSSLISLLRQGNTWLKLSAIYRLSKATTLDEQARHLAPLAHEILTAAPDRVVYASDWPHTRFGSKVNAEGYRDTVVKWCSDIDHTGGLAEKIFLTNPEELWK